MQTYCTVVTIHTLHSGDDTHISYFDIKISTLCPQSIFIFFMILVIYSDYFPKQH